MYRISKWTKKYKNSIDCNNPKGFSQRAHCQGKKKKRKKVSMEYLNRLAELAETLEIKGQYKEANIIHNMFVREADKFKPQYMVEFPVNMDDALNNYDSENYQVDAEGDWEEAEPISEFREEASDELLHAPAAVDDNHIIFENPKNDHIEVMNMIPEHHLDSLHNNKDKQTKWVKRAQ